MNQDFFVKLTKWVLYAAIGVLAVAVFFVFFGERSDRGDAKKYVEDAIGTEGGVSSRSGGDVAMPGFPGMEPSVTMNERMDSPESLDATASSEVSSGAFEKKVIRNGNLSIRVEDAEWSADEIDQIATRLGGFTSSRMMNGRETYPSPLPMMRENAEYDAPLRGAKATGGNTIQSGTVIVKVPSSKFAEAVSAIKGIATVVLSESSSASDVTAQFADLEAQIRNKRVEEEAFTKILNSNPGKVSDILEVTRELARVRGEIEQLETQKKYMESQTDMAEISVYLTEDAKVGAVTDTWRPWQTVKTAMNRLLVQFQNFVDGVIYFLISTLPFFLLYLLGLYVFYRVGKKIYLKIRG
jgi:hypothetical protein